MEQNRKTSIIVAGLVFVALITCGVIGFINDPGHDATPAEQVKIAQSDQAAQADQPAGNPASNGLEYCSETIRLCVVSFGRDNAENMLITVRNNLPALPAFFIKIKQADSEKLFECQKIQFSPDTFYCLGDQIPAEEKVTLEIYSKSDGNLAAAGDLTIHYDLVAEPAPTEAPTLAQPSPTATTETVSTQTPQPAETPTVAYP
jgi:hypothetical protein